jgi:hypothetical protein
VLLRGYDMKNHFVKRIVPYISIFILSPLIMGMGGRPGPPRGGIIPPGLVFILLIILLIPFLMAIKAAKQAEKFKTLVFIVVFYEWLGWILCFSIIGIPIGIGLVLLSQLSRVFIQIEENTSQTLKLLKNQQENRTK